MIILAPPVAPGFLTNLTAASVTATAAAVAAPNLALVTPSIALTAAVPEAKEAVAALSTVSANGSGWTKRLRVHAVYLAAVVLVVLRSLTVLAAAVVLVVALAGVAAAALAGRVADFTPKYPP